MISHNISAQKLGVPYSAAGVMMRAGAGAGAGAKTGAGAGAL